MQNSTKKKPVMATAIVKALLGFALILFAAPIVHAQTLVAPPSVDVTDQNGVNLASGTFTLPVPDVAIGNSESGIRKLAGGSADRFYGGMKIRFRGMSVGGYGGGVLLNEVSFDGATYQFYIGGGTSYGTSTVGSGPFTEVRGVSKLECTGTSAQFFRNGGCVITTGDGTKGVFDCANGCDNEQAILQSITRPDGEVISLTHDVAHRLVSASSSMGWMLKYELDGTYTSYGKITAINTSLSYCDPVAVSCTVSSASPYVTRETTSGNTTISRNGILQTSYSISGNTATITSPSGVTKTVVHSGSDTFGKVASVSVGGSTWTYTYVETNTGTVLYTNSTTVTGPYGVRSVTTNSTGVVSQTDEAGRTVTYVYDNTSPFAPGKIIKVIQPDATYSGATLTGGYTEYEYSAGGNVTKVTVVPKGAGTDTSKYVISSAIYTACNSTNYKFCNKPQSTTDAEGLTTAYEYDALHGGVLSTTTTAVNGVQAQTRYTYSQITPSIKNSAGASISQAPVWRLTATSSCMTANLNGCAGGTDELKTVVSYGVSNTNPTYGNVLPVTTTTSRGDGSLAQTSTLSYDNNGNLGSSDGPKAGGFDAVYYFYDDLNRQIGTIGIDPDGNGARPRQASRTYFDNDGRVWKVNSWTTTGTDRSALDALEAVTPIASDTNEFSSVTGLAITARHYAEGTLTHLTQKSYDAAFRNECVAQRLNQAVFTTITSTAACSVAAEGSDGPDRILKYNYNPDGTILSMISAYGTSQARVNSYSHYNANGTVDYIEDAKGNRTTYTYDNFNRLVGTCYPSPATTHVSSTSDCELTTYIANVTVNGNVQASGRIDHTTLRDGTIIGYAYDVLGRVTTKSLNGTANETFTYNNFGQILSHTNNGAMGTYSYNALGWLLSDAQTLGAVGYEYDAYGRRSKLTYPSGFYVTYSYSDADELTGIYENGATALATFDYDNLGRRAHLYRGNGQTTAYGFDASSRLTSIANPANTLSFTYNVSDQIKTRENSVGSFTYVPSSKSINYGIDGLNRIASINSAAIIGYDARGNLTGDDGATFTYNANNLLTSALQSGVTSTLTYDAENRLFSINKNGATTKFLYDGVDLIAEYADDGTTLLRRYVHGPGEDEPLVVYDQAGAKQYFHADNIGTVTHTTASDGSVTSAYAYDEYGLSQVVSGAFASRFSFTGQVWLPEIGMYYYKARLYNPAIGRFMQNDPIGYADGMNMYAYVGNDPINAIDPSGLEELIVPGFRDPFKASVPGGALCQTASCGSGSGPMFFGPGNYGMSWVTDSSTPQKNSNTPKRGGGVDTSKQCPAARGNRLNLINNPDIWNMPASNLATAQNPFPGTFLVEAHGSENGVAAGDGTNYRLLSPGELADRITSAPGYGGGAATIAACNVGKNINYLQTTANILGQCLRAPTGYAVYPSIGGFIDSVGRKYNHKGKAVADYTRDREWVLVCPKK